jgi:hypothetical protein
LHVIRKDCNLVLCVPNDILLREMNFRLDSKMLADNGRFNEEAKKKQNQLYLVTIRELFAFDCQSMKNVILIFDELHVCFSNEWMKNYIDHSKVFVSLSATLGLFQQSKFISMFGRDSVFIQGEEFNLDSLQLDVWHYPKSELKSKS